MTVAAVLFDLDDTLSRRAAPRDFDAVTAWQVHALTPHLLRLGHEQLDLDAFVRRFWAAFAASYPNPDVDPDAPLEERRWLDGPMTLRQSLEAVSIDCAAADVRSLWGALHSVPPAVRNHHLFPDAVPTVSALHQAGYRLAVVTARPTSAAVVVWELEQQGMPDIFSVVVTSGDEGYRKPHARIFEVALQQLGLQPHQAVMVGDSYEWDIIPAAQLGLTTVLKLNEREANPAWERADHQVSQLCDLLQLACFRQIGASRLTRLP